jgi:moderate conductance mechanosensitive channel
VLSGVFFLLEDAFHIGDYVEVGQLRGTVEGISLRSLKLRHHRGAIHTLPFGQIKALTNLTRDWSLMRLEFRVAPDTDLGLVKRVIKDIGKELEADPEMGSSFIEPLKSQGVRRVEEDAVIIGIKYVTKPGEQFVIRREAYQRILRAFKANGIDLVGRGVVVRVDDAQAGERTVGFAAAQAIRGVLEDKASAD